MTDSPNEEKPIGVVGMQRLQDAWERSQRGEPISSVTETELRDELAALQRRVEALELKVGRLPACVFDHPRR